MGNAGSVIKAIFPIVSVIEELIGLFGSKPDHAAVTDKGAEGAGLTKEEAIAQAKEKFNLDARYKWNFAIIGQTKAGKSSLVNAFQGLRDNDPRAAKVGVTETTTRPEAFPLHSTPNCVIWDLPGSNTIGHPADTYFKDKLLCAFDGLLLASADTFLEGDLRVLAEAKHYEIPVALVRTKADVHIENIMHTDELEADAAERKLRSEAQSNMEQSYAKVGGQLFPRFFIISSRVLYSIVANKKLMDSSKFRPMDEDRLIQWIFAEAKKRKD